MSFCPKCGNQIPDAARFCDKCGSPAPVAAADNQPWYAQSAPQAASVPPAPVQRMRTPVKTDRSLIVYIVLTLLTCGIYGYYFIYKLAKDVNEICAEDGDNIGGLATYILLSFLTCGIYSIYWMYKIQSRLQNIAPRYGVVVSDSGSSVIMWYIFGSLICGIGSFVAMHIVLSSANKVGAAYNAMYFYNR